MSISQLAAAEAAAGADQRRCAGHNASSAGASRGWDGLSRMPVRAPATSGDAGTQSMAQGSTGIRTATTAHCCSGSMQPASQLSCMAACHITLSASWLRSTVHAQAPSHAGKIEGGCAAGGHTALLPQAAGGAAGAGQGQPHNPCCRCAAVQEPTPRVHSMGLLTAPCHCAALGTCA